MILSHRGFWLSPKEKNSSVAFERSFLQGFGTETDIRDYKGKLVISHDIPSSNSMTIDFFFEIYNKYDTNLILALNIKSDGLHTELLKKLKEYRITNYFVFDMSVPDSLSYINKEMNFYARESDYEKNISFYEYSQGIWMDEFNKHWIENKRIEQHLKKGKNVCIVSPELHNRKVINEWDEYRKDYNIASHPHLHLCTDNPLKAKTFFNEKN